MIPVHEHKFRRQPAGTLTLRQFVESLRRWTPEMRAIAQMALIRSESDRQAYLRAFTTHRGHEVHAAPDGSGHGAAGHDPGRLDSFIRWAHSDPRVEHVPALLAELERGEEDYDGALAAEATTLVYLRGEGKSPAQRVRDYLGLLGVESAEPVREAFRRLLPPGTSDETVAATVRLMRRRWLEIYGDDAFFAED